MRVETFSALPLAKHILSHFDHGQLTMVRSLGEQFFHLWILTALGQVV